MTEHIQRRAAGFAGLEHAEGALAGLRARLARHRKYRQTVAELAALSERELSDLGLSRADIRRVAREAATRG